MHAAAPRQRDAQRDASRARVLDASAALFLENGYAATTVRMIAERAMLSPAGVFTTFEDKADILHHVRMAQNAELRAEVERLAVELEGPAVERVIALQRLVYTREWAHLPLVLAYIGASFSWGEETERAMQAAHEGVFHAYRDIVEGGRARGELRADLDPDVAVEIIHGIHLGNYRTGARRGWTAERTADHVEGKLRLLFEGFASR